MGLGASYTVLPTVDVFVTGFSTISGQNTIRASGVAFGMKVGFSPARILRKARDRRPAMPVAGRPPDAR